MKVLSVDDVPLIRKMIKGIVETMGGELLEASDGMEALATLEKQNGNISLVLLDCNMPKMDGFEFLKIVKGHEKYKHIPVIMVTTANEKDKIIRAIQSGASNYLIKPFTEKELAKRIQDCLGLGYERLNKCFSGAVRNVIAASTRLEVQENSGGDEEVIYQEGCFAGQMLVYGKINAIVFWAMKKENAAKLFSLMNKKTASELSNKELVDCIAEMLKMVAVKANALLAATEVHLSFTTPFVSVGYVEENRQIFLKKNAYKMFRKYLAGDTETFLQVHYF